MLYCLVSPRIQLFMCSASNEYINKYSWKNQNSRLTCKSLSIHTPIFTTFLLKFGVASVEILLNDPYIFAAKILVIHCAPQEKIGAIKQIPVILKTVRLWVQFCNFCSVLFEALN